jgi:hypothetical protein
MPTHFLHIRKTGGTAIAEALRPIAASCDIVLHNHDTRLSDVPFAHRVVFFVRHPISRFVSGFCSRQRHGLPRYHYQWTDGESQAFRNFRTPNDLAEALSASSPEVLTRAHAAMREISHVKHTYKEWFTGVQEISDRGESIVLIGLQEELASDFERLKQLLNLPRTLSLPADDVGAHRTPQGFDRSLSALARRNLSQWYSDDLRLYEYCLQLRADRCFQRR